MPAPIRLDDALTEVLDDHLRPLIPDRGGLLPANSVHIVASRGRHLGLGNRRGTDMRLGVPVAALRGVHLDGTARIELWDASANAVDNSMETAHANLLGAIPSLRASGFLRLSIKDSEPAMHSPEAAAWRKTSDLEFLYEYHASDNDDAESFIVRVPVRSDLEVANSPEGTIETVIDAMRRWDEEGAPALIVRPSAGARTVRLNAILTLDFLPGAFAGAPVTVERTVAGAVGAPAVFPTLDAFLDAIGDPAGGGPAATQNAQVGFTTLGDFLAALGPPGDPFELGDWNEDMAGDVYLPRVRAFARPVTLRTGRDLFAIRYQAPAFASAAVLYLRVLADQPNPG